jgi:integrase/recombinase XerC
MKKNIERFIVSLQARNCSPNAVRAYQADLDTFLQFAGAEITPEQVDRSMVRTYLSHLHEQGATPRTTQRKRACLKSLLRFLVEESAIKQNPFASLRAAKCAQELPEIPSQGELSALLEGDVAGPFPERDRLILELLYGTGVRVQELVGINLNDFCGDDVILVRGKGKKERFVIFGEYAQAALRAYLPVRTALLAKQKRSTGALLFGVRAQQTERLTERSVVRIVKHVAHSKGLPERHPHAFRHAFATHLLDGGASIVAICRLLGHVHLSTTERYTRVSVGHMLNAYAHAHPHGSKPTVTAELEESHVSA